MFVVEVVMQAGDFVAILPLVCLAFGPVSIIALGALRPNRGFSFYLGLASCIAAILTIPWAASAIPRNVTPLLAIDTYGLFYVALVVANTLVVMLFSRDYQKMRGYNPERYYALLLLAALGGSLLVTANHFASLLLALETLSISLYALIAYDEKSGMEVEGAVKYLLLSAVSAAFLLFGMALIYAETGTMEFPALGAKLSTGGTGPAVMAATVLIVMGLGFKLAVVPFHMWTPDVYQASPAPVAAFIATVSKGAVFALLLRYFTEAETVRNPSLYSVFVVIAVASMFTGNLLALFQNNVKRLLAYSSIAHLGYLLVPFLAAGPLRVAAVTYYLVAYSVTTLGAFGVISTLSSREGDADQMQDYYGLFSRRPWFALAFTAILLSLAGIPVTAGFVGKFYVMGAGIESGLWWPVLSLVVTSAVGLFYYLRVIVVMYVYPPVEGAKSRRPASRLSCLILWVLMALLIWWGVYPSHLASVVEALHVGI
jgi:NADH-quinone oxidoreductase subunit N